jgi:hypothetical protein
MGEKRKSRARRNGRADEVDEATIRLHVEPPAEGG